MRKYYSFLLLAIICVACYKDEGSIDIIIPDFPTDVFIDTKIRGQITTKNGIPIINGQLKINNESYAFKNGIYDISVSKARKNGQFISIWQNNTFLSSGYFLLKENDINQLNIIVDHDSDTKYIDPNQNNTIPLSSQLSVLFEKNAFLLQNKTYTELVRIQYTWSNEPLYQLQMGNHGYNSNGQLLCLSTLESFTLDFSTDKNEGLTTNDQSKAISIILHDTFEPNVGLFYFDSDQQKWLLINEKLENSSLHKGGMYRLASYVPGLIQEGTLTVRKTPLSYQNFKLTSQLYTHYTYTTEKGQWLACLPYNTNIELISNNSCPVFLGELTTSNLPTHRLIEVDTAQLASATFTLHDCTGQKIKNGYISINNTYYTSIYEANDIPDSIWLFQCNDKILVNHQTSDMSTQILRTQNINMVGGALVSCDNTVDGYSIVDINNDINIFDAFQYSVENNRLKISSNDGKIVVYLRGPEKSHYESKDINIYINDPDFGTTGYYIKCEQSPIGCGFKDAVLHTTKIDGIEYLKLDLSGTLWLQKISTLQAGHFPIQATIYCKK